MDIGSIFSSPSFSLGFEREAPVPEAPTETEPASRSGHYEVTISDEALAMARGMG